MDDIDRANYGSSDDYFVFRNEHMLVTVLIQMFLLFAGCVVVVGVIYFVIIILAIVVHHVLFDRDPYKVPDFIRNSSQFQGDGDEDDDGGVDRNRSLESETESNMENSDDIGYNNRGPTAMKKAEIMDKFVTDLDNTRKMKYGQQY